MAACEFLNPLQDVLYRLVQMLTTGVDIVSMSFGSIRQIIEVKPKMSDSAPYEVMTCDQQRKALNMTGFCQLLNLRIFRRTTQIIAFPDDNQSFRIGITSRSKLQAGQFLARH